MGNWRVGFRRAMRVPCPSPSALSLQRLLPAMCLSSAYWSQTAREHPTLGREAGHNFDARSPHGLSKQGRVGSVHDFDSLWRVQPSPPLCGEVPGVCAMVAEPGQTFMRVLRPTLGRRQATT